MKCPKCGHNYSIECKACGRQYTVNRTKKMIPQETRQRPKKRTFSFSAEESKRISKELEIKFKILEKKASLFYECPANKYLVIRLDGFQLTKKYLRNMLINKNFNTQFLCAVNILSKSFIHYFSNDHDSAFVCGYLANDELSIVLNKDFCGKKEGRKLIKICTLFSGLLSASFTMLNCRSDDEKSLVIFDARPLVLDKSEIVDYLYSRYLISTRYAFGKVWKLNSNDYIDAERLYDLEISKKYVSEMKKFSQVEEVLDSYKIFFYTPFDKKFNFKSEKIDKDGFNVDYIKNKLLKVLKQVANK